MSLTIFEICEQTSVATRHVIATADFRVIRKSRGRLSLHRPFAGHSLATLEQTQIVRKFGTFEMAEAESIVARPCGVQIGTSGQMESKVGGGAVNLFGG
jgi:hypothetical protein